MWGLPLSWMLVLTAAVGGPAGAAGTSLPEPIYTRQALFAIPFRIEKTAQTETDPASVQLQVSVDRGRTWRPHSKVQPNLGRFQFRADADGEYWFFVQTVDSQGRLRPPQITLPGLRVVVDTTPPKLEIDARRGPNGEITVRWRVAEMNLDPDSVRILYRTDASPTLQSVAIARNQLVAPAPVRAGDASWWLQGGGTRVEIRAEARDRAGNAAVTHAQVDLQSPAPSQAVTAPANQPVAAPSAATQVAGGSPTEWRSVRPTPAPFPWQRPTVAPLEQHATLPPPNPQPSPVHQPRPDPQPSPDTGGPSLGGSPPASTLHTASMPVPEASVAIQINPAVGNAFPSPVAAGSSEDGNGLRPRVVNLRMFELEYSVDSVGPSGIAQVELWGTRDGGKTWTSFGTDDDKKSPFVVTVPDEGEYGFRISVRSGVGLGGEPPTPGNAPDIRVLVDLTKPDVRILAAEQLTGEELGKVVIRWEARDRALARQPVSLFYSASPGGPWQPIAANLENSGQYSWLAGKDVPERIYLRVEARDEAGNLGIFESPQPVALDRRRPSVRIHDIRPVTPPANPTPATAPRPQ